MAQNVQVVDAAFAPDALLKAFMDGIADSGALASFTGVVRGGERITALELSHYAPLTLPGMVELGDMARARFGLQGLTMVHRIGRMVPGEAIVFVAAAAAHRRAAFDAVDFAMDHLKSRAWFWKRELRPDGTWAWITPRADDYADAARWEQP